MRTVNSKDGTTIAFDQAGQGPALILVGGTFEQRAMDSATAQLAGLPLLSQHLPCFIMIAGDAATARHNTAPWQVRRTRSLPRFLLPYW